MRVVVQRVRRASVTVGGVTTATIAEGLVVLIGISTADATAGATAGAHTGPDTGAAGRLAAKVAKLRIFPDDDGVMNRSVADHGGAVLAVSQFTLYGDTRKGNRPSYIDAAPGPAAEPVYRAFCDALRDAGLAVAEGVFGADMDVELVNWGPVTILLDTEPAAGGP